MGWNDHLYDTPLEQAIETCSECGKVFRCSEENQQPGFRDRDYKICPFCNQELATSMSLEYYCSKLTEEEISYLIKKGIITSKDACK